MSAMFSICFPTDVTLVTARRGPSAARPPTIVDGQRRLSPQRFQWVTAAAGLRGATPKLPTG